MEIKLSSKIYPLEAILNTSYTFIDRAYIYLDYDSKGDIKVSFKSKEKISKQRFKNLKGEFMNELLHCALRYQISKNNKKIREYIIGRALYSALPTQDLFPTEELDYQKDPLGIAIPWEEKYGKKSKSPRRQIKD